MVPVQATFRPDQAILFFASPRCDTKSDLNRSVNRDDDALAASLSNEPHWLHGRLNEM